MSDTSAAPARHQLRLRNGIHPDGLPDRRLGHHFFARSRHVLRRLERDEVGCMRARGQQGDGVGRHEVGDDMPMDSAEDQHGAFARIKGDLTGILDRAE